MVYGTLGIRRGYEFDGLVQERRNSSALAMELRFSCTNSSNYSFVTIVILGLMGAWVIWNLHVDQRY